MGSPTQPSRRMYTISDLVHEFDVSARTIRHYEEWGLLNPIRSAGNHRLFSHRDRARLRMILRGRRLGFTLQEITNLLHLYDVDPTEREQLRVGIQMAQTRLQEIRSRARELRALESDLDHALRQAERRFSALQEGPAGPTSHAKPEAQVDTAPERMGKQKSSRARISEPTPEDEANG